jgi:hypothetical protein
MDAGLLFVVLSGLPQGIALDTGIDSDRQDLSGGSLWPAIGQAYGGRNYCDCDGRKP